MGEKIIDPSEIIIDKTGAIKEDHFHANPWMRFLARFFDYAWWILLLVGLRIWLNEHWFFDSVQSVVPVEFFFWIPVEALLLSMLGTTPGKFFLKIKLRQGRRPKLDFRCAIKRSFNVWLRGLGMMIPIINGLCLLVAYHRLNVFQITTWDKEDHITVSHTPIGRWRIVIAALFAGLALFFYFHRNSLGS